MSLKQEWREALINRIGLSLYEQFSNATVAICGLGGLGSHIAIALARAGVGKLILIDFDQVDMTNLHRQCYKVNQMDCNKTEALLENILEVAPYIDIEAINEKITEDNIVSLLKDADIVCEAFDDPSCKAMLVNGVLEKLPDCYVVAASGMAGMGSPNLIKTRKLTNRFYLCGDEVSDVKNTMGLVSSRVMLCAAHQAHTILRILAGE